MRFFTHIFSIIFSLIIGSFLSTYTYAHKLTTKPKIQSTTKIEPKAKPKPMKVCLLPGYKSQYEAYYNGSDLGVSTRIAEKMPNGNYEITYKISVHKFIFSKIINRTSEGKIDINGEVYPTKFKVIDGNTKNPKVFNIKKDQLDPLSYITQLRINMMQGKKVIYITEETLLGERKATLKSSLKLHKEKINGKYTEVIKVIYTDNKDNNGILWLDPKKQYLPVKTLINTKKGTIRSGTYTKIQEVLINYDPNISKYGCLYYSK